MVALVSQALGEFAASMDPVPTYHEDNRASHHPLYETKSPVFFTMFSVLNLSLFDKVREADGSPVLYHEIVQDNWSNTLGSTEVVKTYYPLTRFEGTACI